jgi:DNA-binding MarR family transcriptional regulator
MDEGSSAPRSYSMDDSSRKFPAEFLGFWVHHLRSAMQARLEEHVKKIGLTSSEGLLLTMLRFKGPSSLVEISGMMGLAHPSVLRTLDSLEERQLVQRTPHENDRRIKIVVLTEQGLELETKVNRILQSVHKLAVNNMTEDEIQQFFGLFRRAILNVGGDECLPPPQAFPPDQRPKIIIESEVSSDKENK